MSGPLSPELLQLAGRITLPELAALTQAVVARPAAAGVAAKLEDLEALLAIESMVAGGQVTRLVDAIEVDATVAECGRAPKAWLVEEMRLNPGEAAKRMRLAKGLPDAPEIFAALAAGEIHPEHALVILKVLPHIADGELRATVEKTLVQVAREEPPFQVERAVDDVLALLGIETDSQAAYERRYAQRGVGLDETIGGTGSLNGTLTPEVREKLRLALEAASAPAGPEDDRTLRQRFHDALGEICDFYLAQRENLTPVAGERPRVIVTIDLDMLLGQLEDQWATALLGAHTRIGPETARRLACDADVIPAVLNAKSDVLDLGRSSSTFNLAIRRAAWLEQHGRCAFPRCTRPPAECHHIVWWSKGGRTSLDNAAWLCTFHHWLVHEGGWTMRRDPDRGFTFRSPDGRQVSTGPPRHPEAA